jgi:hypothetical protein
LPDNKKGCPKKVKQQILLQKNILYFREALKIIEDAMRESPAKKRGA